MEKFDFIVLGGGVSGLGFAKRMSEHGFSVLILEKENVVGGLSRSLHYNDFYLDFCAHRFHTNNKELLAEILALPGLTMQKHIKKSRIYMFGRYLKYPFEIQNLLRAMPLRQSISGGVSFLWNVLKNQFQKGKPPLQSYKDWFVNIYGNKLYEVMCYPYTSKIWHIDPASISADWADQRFQGENMPKLIKRIIKKILTLNFSNYNLEDDSLAPDGGPFYYPMRGIQELPDALARASLAHGAKILCAATIEAVNTKAQEVIYRYQGKAVTVQYGDLVSTIPLHQFYNLQDRKDKTVEGALAGLKYMDIIFVFLFLNQKQVSNDHWLYFPDTNIIYNRAVEFSNWSPEMCPEGKTAICFDITTFENNAEWNMSDEELAKRTIDDAVRIKYLKRENIDSHYVFRVKYAYPFYDLNYKTKLDGIVKFLEGEHINLLGRTGIFQYNNSDNSIEMGFKLADNYIAKIPKKTIYEAKVRAISY